MTIILKWDVKFYSVLTMM